MPCVSSIATFLIFPSQQRCKRGRHPPNASKAVPAQSPTHTEHVHFLTGEQPFRTQAALCSPEKPMGDLSILDKNSRLLHFKGSFAFKSPLQSKCSQWTRLQPRLDWLDLHMGTPVFCKFSYTMWKVVEDLLFSRSVSVALEKWCAGQPAVFLNTHHGLFQASNSVTTRTWKVPKNLWSGPCYVSWIPHSTESMQVLLGVSLETHGCLLLETTTCPLHKTVFISHVDRHQSAEMFINHDVAKRSRVTMCAHSPMVHILLTKHRTKERSETQQHAAMKSLAVQHRATGTELPLLAAQSELCE